MSPKGETTVPNPTPIYTLAPVGTLDLSTSRITRHTGADVQKVQPPGTPPNGAMRMCFVQHAQTGEFIGQVCLSSLKRTGRRQIPRDLAAEARDARSTRGQRTASR
jgi:hypothetical protein